MPTNQYQNFAYGLGENLIPLSPLPIVAERAPTVRDRAEIGTLWVDRPNDASYLLTSVVAGESNWQDLISFTNGTNGQLLIGGGTAATWATVTSTGGTLVFTPGANSLNIEVSGATTSSYTTDVGGPVSPLAGVLDIDGGLNMSTDGSVANRITFDLADDVTLAGFLNAAGAVTAGVDLTMSTGDCTISADTDAAQTIYLHADGGTSETIELHSDQGTGVDSIHLYSDVGGLTLAATALASDDAINIAAGAGGVDVDAAMQISLVSTENSADAIVINAGAGGIDITSAGAAGEDIDITASSSINIVSTENVASAIHLHTNAGVTETINIHADQGTGVDSINLHSDDGGITLISDALASDDAINLTATAGGVDIDGAMQVNIASSENTVDAIVISSSAGGIDITSGGAATEDIDITASSSINLVSTEDAAQSLYLHANGGTSETIHLHSDQGTGVASIDLESDDGGITLTSTALASDDAINLEAVAGGIDVDAALSINVASSQAAATAIVVNASDAAGGIDVDYGTGGMSVVGANGAFALETGTGAIDIGADAAAHVVTIGNVTGATQVVVNAGTAGIQMASTGAGDIEITSSDTMLLDSAGVLELNSSAGVIGIGNDAVAQNINIGTGAAARVITIGNITGATGVDINAGTAGSTITATDGTIALVSGTGAINIGVDAAVHTVTVGSTTGAADTVIQSGTGGIDINSNQGNIDIISGTGALNVGTDATAHILTLGSTNTTAQTIVQSGTGDLNLTSTDSITLDCAGALDLNSTAGTIAIGNDADNQAITVGAAGARTITIGNNTGATSVVCQCGTGPAYFGANATAHLSILGSVTGASATTVQAGTGDFTITAGGILDVNGVGAVTIDTAGVIELNSTAGAISIGNDDIDQNINIGTDGVRVVTVGSTNTTASTTVQSGTGGISLAAAGIVDVVPATATFAGAAVTINANVGVGTFTGLVTAAAATQVFTITNSVCTTSSAILVSASTLGANDCQMTVTRVTPGAGSFTVTLTNNGAAACNGNIIITFWIIA